METTADNAVGRTISSRRSVERLGYVFVAPAMILIGGLFFLPVLGLVAYSFATQDGRGGAGLPATLANYSKFFETPLYSSVLMTTLRVSAWTAIASAVIAYPVAIAVVRGGVIASRTITIAIIAPLLVSVVVRTYGWQIILANSPTGVLNWLLLHAGVISSPLRIMYTETAVVVGSVHVFLPLMILPLAGSLGRIPPSFAEAAATLGASAWAVFWRVTFPLSFPGLAAGLSLVFSLTASSFVGPRILGGTDGQMLGTLIEQQVSSAYDWPFASAIAVVLVSTVMILNSIGQRYVTAKPHDKAG
ncbi:hypothetical protein UP09_05465 [Bradyrhizobium sp. LTSP885]|uniref:ABC transporter permease n=1 Tax=Bradyrhizobium sp. LTSP885 TaxID=1619232 RepID=UPI0005CAB6F7|nr:ABC transporter permease [Bradyrhizobium sp. LTSP885]KJC50458.1 hypothetical protein UP09_05465 [Bradyrhizobium sp. LTSP885]